MLTQLITDVRVSALQPCWRYVEGENGVVPGYHGLPRGISSTSHISERGDIFPQKHFLLGSGRV